MGIFNKRGDRNSFTKESTTISQKTKVIGEMVLESNLHIDGEIEGRVSSNALVSIGKSGQFQGEVKAKKLIVSGVFNGKVDSEIVEIMNGGRVMGEVNTTNLIIHDKGIFDGVCKHKEEIKLDEPKQLEE